MGSMCTMGVRGASFTMLGLQIVFAVLTVYESSSLRQDINCANWIKE
jgi:hypothetical protein